MVEQTGCHLSGQGWDWPKYSIYLTHVLAAFCDSTWKRHSCSWDTMSSSHRRKWNFRMPLRRGQWDMWPILEESRSSDQLYEVPIRNVHGAGGYVPKARWEAPPGKNCGSPLTSMLYCLAKLYSSMSCTSGGCLSWLGIVYINCNSYPSHEQGSLMGLIREISPGNNPFSNSSCGACFSKTRKTQLTQ